MTVTDRFRLPEFTRARVQRSQTQRVVEHSSSQVGIESRSPKPQNTILPASLQLSLLRINWTPPKRYFSPPIISAWRHALLLPVWCLALLPFAVSKSFSFAFSSSSHTQALFVSRENHARKAEKVKKKEEVKFRIHKRSNQVSSNDHLLLDSTLSLSPFLACATTRIPFSEFRDRCRDRTRTISVRAPTPSSSTQPLAEDGFSRWEVFRFLFLLVLSFDRSVFRFCGNLTRNETRYANAYRTNRRLFAGVRFLRWRRSTARVVRVSIFELEEERRWSCVYQWSAWPAFLRYWAFTWGSVTVCVWIKLILCSKLMIKERF